MVSLLPRVGFSPTPGLNVLEVAPGKPKSSVCPRAGADAESRGTPLGHLLAAGGWADMILYWADLILSYNDL